MDELEKLRNDIDKIDQKFVKLFEARIEKVLKIAEYKRKNNMPILHPSREEEVLKKNTAHLENKDLKKFLEDFFVELMRVSKEVQEKDKGIPLRSGIGDR